MALLGERVESFPFDSTENGYDEDGYPVYDRAVGARSLRATFKEFFSDGVFPSDANALYVSKASGLNVYINPGVFIIRGAMGYVNASGNPLMVQLSATPPQGNTAYGIMLRYDENQDARCCSVRVVSGTPNADPQPPEPDKTSPGICEYMLASVSVPSGATDLTNATITNYRGTESCPFAAPFEKIDLSSVTNDARVSANEALDAFYAYIEQNKGLLDSALDDTTAGYLQTQITAIQEQLANIDFSGSADDVTIEYAQKSGMSAPKLMVKDSGITTGKIADFNVTAIKLSADLQIKLDVVDTDGWTFDQYYSFVQELAPSDQADFIGQMDAAVVQTWTEPQLKQMCALFSGNDQKTLVQKCSISSYTWAQIVDLVINLDATGRSGLVGKDKSTSVLGSSVTFRCVGVDKDASNSASFASVTGVGSTKAYTDSSVPSMSWEQCTLSSYVNNTVLPTLDSGLRSLLKTCQKEVQILNGNTEAADTPMTLWPLSWNEVANTDKYEYFASGGGLSYDSVWSRDASYVPNSQYNGFTALSYDSSWHGHTYNQTKTFPTSIAFCI